MNKLPTDFVTQERVGAMRDGFVGWIDPRDLQVDLENNAFLDPNLNYSKVETPKMSMRVVGASITVIKNNEMHHWRGKVLDPKIKWIKITEVIVK